MAYQPLSRCRDPDRADFQHLRAPDASRRRAGASRLHGPESQGGGSDRFFGDGTQTRSFCYVDDLVEGIHRLLCSEEAYPVNLGNPDEITLLELAHRVLEVTGSKSRIVYRELPEDDPKVRRPDIGKARRLLGWEPKVSLDEGLHRVLPYFRSKGGVALCPSEGHPA